MRAQDSSGGDYQVDPKTGNNSLTEEIRQWPTAAASNAHNDTTLQCSGDGRKKPNKLGWAVAWNTPKACNTDKGGNPRENDRADLLAQTRSVGPCLPDPCSGTGSRPGSLNDKWVAALMGFPLDWLDVPAENGSAP